MRKVFRQANKWEIEQTDVGKPMLLSGGEDRLITNDDVGMWYVIDTKKGDFLEEPPYDVDEEEFDNEEDDY